MDWLREHHQVENGSKVIFQSARGNRYYVVEVSRTTATMIMVQINGREFRFRKKDGQEVSSDPWFRAQIYPTTPENLAEVEQAVKETEERFEKSELTNQIIAAAKSRKLPLEALRKLAAIVEEYSD